MSLFKKSLIVFSLFSVLSSAEEADSQKSINEFQGEIILVESLNKVWIQLSNEDVYGEVSKKIPLRNKRNKHLSLPVFIYGIDDTEMKDIEDKEGSKEYQAFANMSQSLDGKEATVKCFERSVREGIPICTVRVNGVDIAGEIILYGFSAFYEGKKKSPGSLDEQYQNAENIAKENKAGIWEPYYSLRF